MKNYERFFITIPIGILFVWLGFKDYPNGSFLSFIFAIIGAIIISYSFVTLDFANARQDAPGGKE